MIPLLRGLDHSVIPVSGTLPAQTKGRQFYSDAHRGLVVSDGSQWVNITAKDAFQIPRFSGDVVTTTPYGVAPGTSLATANQVRAALWIPDGDYAINSLAFEVTTLLAGNARAAIYDADGADGFFPGTKLWVGGEISTATASIKTNAISPTLAVKAGHPLWLCLHSQAGYSYRGQPANGVQARNFGMTAAGSITVLSGLQANLTYVAATDSFPASGASLFPRTTRSSMTAPHFTMTIN